MQDQLNHQQFFSFNTEIILVLYEETNRLFGYVQLQTVMELYEDEVETRLKDLHDAICADGEYEFRGHPWKDLNVLPPETVDSLNEWIGIKTQISKMELEDVFEFYNMVYFDDEKNLKNPPIREVW